MSVYRAKSWAPSSLAIAHRDGQFQTDRWCAQISVGGKTHYLGSFPSREAARAAWRAAGGKREKPVAPKAVPFALPSNLASGR
jgi:hypothetical protein